MAFPWRLTIYPRTSIPFLCRFHHTLARKQTPPLRALSGGGGTYNISKPYHTLQYDTEEQEFHENHNSAFIVDPTQKHYMHEAIPLTQELLGATEGTLPEIENDLFDPPEELPPTTTEIKFQWKIGDHPTSIEKADVIALLESNRDCFAFSLEELGTSNNTPMELPLDTIGSIFQGSHKLTQTVGLCGNQL